MGIGIMSVILMLSLGKGVTSYVSGQMNTYSNPLVAEIQKTSSQKMQQKKMQDAQKGDSAALAKQQQENMNSLSGTSAANSFSSKDLRKLKRIKHVKKLQKGYTAISLGTNQISYKKKRATLIYLKTVNDAIAKSEIKHGRLPKLARTRS